MKTLWGQIADAYRKGVSEGHASVADGEISIGEVRKYASLPFYLGLPASFGTFFWLWQHDGLGFATAYLIGVAVYPVFVALAIMITANIMAAKAGKWTSDTKRT